MENSFEIFEYKGSRTRYTPTVSILGSGIIGLSSGFMTKHNLGTDLKGAQLLFDRTQKTVGLRLLKTKEAGLLSIKHVKPGGAQIKAAAFFHKFDVNPKSVVGKYFPSELEGMFIFQIKPITT